MAPGSYYQREGVYNLWYGEVNDGEMLEKKHTGRASAYQDSSVMNDQYKSSGLRELTTRARR